MLFDALQRREQAASTAPGAGFAIPHARLSGIERPVTVFTRLRSAIPFGAADGIPVTCVLVIIVPKNGADADHLTMLGLVSALFSAGDFRKRIAVASDVVTAEAAFRTCISTLVQKAHVD
ncbi:MAG: PTS sugar transporter subunit IIA [Burkholderiaceae bacterium]